MHTFDSYPNSFAFYFAFRLVPTKHVNHSATTFEPTNSYRHGHCLTMAATILDFCHRKKGW